MKLINNITPLTKQETENIKGGYLFTCEEKKRAGLMKITAYTDSGLAINTYKINTSAAASFMTNFTI